MLLSAVVSSAAVRRSPTLRAFLLFVLIFGALFTYEVSALFYQETGVPAIERGERPRTVGEIAGETVAMQTFGVHAGGLSGVTIAARPFAQGVAGTVVFTVADVGPARRPGEPPRPEPPREVARVMAPAREVVAGAEYRVEFASVDDSSGREYRLVIAAPDARPGQGLGLWGTRDQVYEGGMLTVGGKEQWGDLVFRAHAERATLFRRVEHELADQPGWLRSRWMLGALIVLYNWALATFTWYMLFVEDEPGDEVTV